MAAPPLPSLVEFLKELKTRLEKEVPSAKSRVALPILAIAETVDSFLIDSIADANREFSQIWPKAKEFDEDPELVEAFVALVTAAKTVDPNLQKICDKVVPKKAAELVFWRRYFAHCHALLIRLAPTEGEATRDMLGKMPAPRPVEARRFAPAATLRAKGRMPKEDLIELLTKLADMMSSSETVTALGDDAAVAVGEGDAPNLEMGVNKMCLTYQLEYMEHLGFAREFGLVSMQPASVMGRFQEPTGKDKPVYEAMQAFQQACMQVAPMAVQRQQQRPSTDPKARRFRPMPGGPIVTEQSQLKKGQLLSVVKGITGFLEEEESQARLKAIVGEQAEEAKQSGVQGLTHQHIMQAAQQEMLHTMAKWQREYLESVGIDQDVGIGAIWSIADRYQPDKKKAHSTMQSAMIDATKPQTKPVSERRFAPKEGALQTEGLLSREATLLFTTKCAEMLLSEQTKTILDKCTSMQEVSTLSVQWQRELLEHVGVEMDFGCKQLGNTPARFPDDKDVLKAFNEFVSACQQSAESAVKRMQAKADGKAALEVS